MKKRINIIIAIAIVLVVTFGVTIGKSGFGTGDGSQKGTQVLEKAVFSSEEDDTVIVYVEETTIYFDSEECSDLDELRNRMSEYQAKHPEGKFKFEQDHAIKSVADDVRGVMIEISAALNVEIII